MPLDPTYVGRRFPAHRPYAVGREKIAEFATAIGADDAVYLDPDAARAAGYPDVIAPPTFAIVLTEEILHQLIADEGLGLDFSRVVHGEQRYAYHRPIRAGDVLATVSEITDITERAGNGFLTARAEIATEAGEAVVVATMKLVVRA